jgi:hypothetical protein
MITSRKTEIAWTMIRVALGLPLLAAEAGLAGASMTGVLTHADRESHAVRRIELL